MKKIMVWILWFSFLGMGCTTVARQQPELEKNWGRSFESARYNQIIAVDARDNQKPVTGLNGEAAVVNMEKYTAGESASPPPPAEPSVNINLNAGK